MAPVAEPHPEDHGQDPLPLQWVPATQQEGPRPPRGTLTPQEKCEEEARDLRQEVLPQPLGRLWENIRSDPTSCQHTPLSKKAKKQQNTWHHSTRV